MKEGIVFNPIGVVHRKASDDEVRSEKSGLESEVEIFPHYKDALDGIEGFSHIFVLGYFHRLRPEQVGPLRVKPKRMIKYGLKPEDVPLVGDFTLDSPTRPNPIGLSLVRLLRIEEGRKLIVLDLDYFDGTPVIDIKPYQPGYRSHAYTHPDWYVDLVRKIGLPPSRSI